MDPTTLVTGGAGFMGSHLCERLLARGETVICLDNFFTGSKANIRHLLDNPEFELLRHNIWEPVFLEVNRIFNLACPASPVHYQRDPVSTVKTSVLGATNMLGLAKRTGARILQASTSEVYGDPEIHPQTEAYTGNVNPIGRRACYDEGKRCAETLFFDYHRMHQVDIRISRIFNTYGPRMHPNDGRVVSTFIIQALKGEDLPIFGDGTQTRSFCYVDDMVEGLVRLMDRDDLTGPVNMGNPVEVSVRTLAEQILAITGSRARIAFLPAVADDPHRRKPDISYARDTLDWQPTVDLADGLRETVTYFRALLAK